MQVNIYSFISNMLFQPIASYWNWDGKDIEIRLHKTNLILDLILPEQFSKHELSSTYFFDNFNFLLNLFISMSNMFALHTWVAAGMWYGCKKCHTVLTSILFWSCEKEVQPILLLKKSLNFSIDFYWHCTQVMHLQALPRPIHCIAIKKSLTASKDFYWHCTKVMHLQALP